MTKRPDKSDSNYLESEIGAYRKDRRGRLRIALLYPNTYPVGMSNLGFQTVYAFLNSVDEIICERAFLPKKTGRIKTVESGSRLTDFHILAFSISFENDYPGVLRFLEEAKLPFRFQNRQNDHPLILGGGVACSINPEPLAPFMDAFVIGESEEILRRLFEHGESVGVMDLKSNGNKTEILEYIAKNIPGIYVPAFYNPTWHKDGTLKSITPKGDFPKSIKRLYINDISKFSTDSAILTPNTTFDDTFLIEVGRGCPHGCRFCSAGYIYRPPRFRPLSLLKKEISQITDHTDRVGLVGAAVSDLPNLTDLCHELLAMDMKISFSSLRADAITPELVRVMKKSGVKTATIAPEAGTERMRRVINKGITRDDVLNAADLLVAGGIPNLKLYFMIGLPTETMDDVLGIVTLCKEVKEVFLKASRIKKRIGNIGVSVSCFVPKPFTPFQWVGQDDVPLLKKKIKLIQKGLKRVPNVTVSSEAPKNSKIQALLSRGDQRVADAIEKVHENRGNWSQTLREVPFEPEFYTERTRPFDETLPWDIIEHGVTKEYLIREYQSALEGKNSLKCKVGKCVRCGVCK